MMNPGSHYQNDGSIRLHTSDKIIRRAPEFIEKSQRVRNFTAIYKSLQNIGLKSKKLLQTKELLLRSNKGIDYKLSTQKLNKDTKSDQKFSKRAKTPTRNETINPVKYYKSKPINKDKIGLEIIKAGSDLFELKRDLATYEFELTGKCDLKRVKDFLSEKLLSISKNLDSYTEASNNTNLIKKIGDITKNLKNPSFSEVSIKSVSEQFFLKPRKNQTNGKSFQGFVLISGMIFLCKVFSSSFSSHCIQFILPNGKSGKITVEEIQLEQSSSNYSEFLKNSIFPHCYAYYFKEELGFIFDPLHSVEFISSSLSIKGIGKVVLKIFPEEDELYLEVVKCNLQLFISYKKLEAFEIDNKKLQRLEKCELKRLINVLKKSLIFYKRKLLFDCEIDFFCEKEANSDLMNEDLLRFTFRNYMKKKTKFIIRVQGRKVKVVIFDETLIIISIKKRKKVSLDLQDIRFLNELQDISIVNDPITFSGSLELRSLIKKLFSL